MRTHTDHKVVLEGSGQFAFWVLDRPRWRRHLFGDVMVACQWQGAAFVPQPAAVTEDGGTIRVASYPFPGAAELSRETRTGPRFWRVRACMDKDCREAFVELTRFLDSAIGEILVRSQQNVAWVGWSPEAHPRQVLIDTAAEGGDSATMVLEVSVDGQQFVRPLDPAAVDALRALRAERAPWPNE